MFEAAVVDLRSRRNPMPAGALLALLEAAEPGPDVIAALAAFDPATLGEYDQVVLLRTIERQRHWLDALQQPAIAAVAGGRDTSGRDWGGEEVAVALRLSAPTATGRIDTARMLTAVLARTLAALRSGLITVWHARALADAVAGMTVNEAGEVESLALPKAVGDLDRPGEGVAAFRRTVARAVAAVDADRVAANRRAARSERRVSSWTDHSTATGSVVAEGLSAEQVDRVMTAIRYWSGKTGADDPRTADQRMADALVDICDDALSRAQLTPAQARKVTTSIVMDFPTWAGLAENPAWLDGHGPIPAAVAHELAAGGKLRRLITDPETGTLLDSSPDTYTPSEPLKRYLRDRNRVCDFPGCNRRATTADLDHTTRWADGGKTIRANLGPLCGRHHTLRHDTRWHITRDPDGATTWTSPTGHTYRKPPWDYRPLE